MKLLLLGRSASFIVDTEQKKFSCQFGSLDLSSVKPGSFVKLGRQPFAVLLPSRADLLRRARRMPQVVLPKDAASILAVTGSGPSSVCLDAGSGSGFLSLFLSSYVKSVVTYEKNAEFAKNVCRNIGFCGAGNVTLVNKPVQSAKLKPDSFDLVTLDIPNAQSLVPKMHKALKPGGWLCIYSPQIEQHSACVARMKRFVSVQTLENIQRTWKSVAGFTHPHHSQVVHTGFLTFGRKFK